VKTNLVDWVKVNDLVKVYQLFDVLEAVGALLPEERANHQRTVRNTIRSELGLAPLP